MNLKLKQTLVNHKLLISETFRKSAKVEGKFVRQSGGRGQYGHVWIEFEPNEAGKGFEFVNKIVGGVYSK